MKDAIDRMILKRNDFLDKEDADAASLLELEIKGSLLKNFYELPVEVILETLSKLGHAPSLLYDDNAHWTVGGDGFQNLITNDMRDKETHFEGGWVVGPNKWNKTIRAAVFDYVQEIQ